MYNLQRIKEIPIVEVAERLGMDLQRCGRWVRTECLWHTDKNPSLYLGGQKNIAHCFACGHTTDVIGLVMQYRNIGFKEACEWLSPTQALSASLPRPLSPSINAWACPKRGKGRRPLPASPRRGEFFVVPEEYYAQFLPSPPPFLSMAPPFPLLGQAQALMEGERGRGREASSFARCLSHVFGAERTAEIVHDYRLGAISYYGRCPDVMFPSIDVKGRIRDIKVQAYDFNPTSERFFHSLKNVCYWLGPTLWRDKVFNRDCLFGEHLLNKYADRIVVLVESPKNACVGSAAYPEFLWVATGNKNGLKRSVIEVLRGRDVVVFPDEDAFDEWKEKIDSMQDIATFIIKHPPGEGEKRDIADYILKDPSQPPH